jgi:hypothetical protein
MADYIRDLRSAKWGSTINLHCKNLEPKCAAANNFLFNHLVGEREQERLLASKIQPLWPSAGVGLPQFERDRPPFLDPSTIHRGSGSALSRTLLGPYKSRPKLARVSAVWPFETGWAAKAKWLPAHILVHEDLPER